MFLFVCVVLEPQLWLGENMRAYACVYRKIQPKDAELRSTTECATNHPLLQRFLEAYRDRFLDWGDDPGFFAAERLLGDIRRASWGVCRPDVRSSIGIGSFVVFFVGVPDDGRWHYYWTGLGTVGQLVRDRIDLFEKPNLKPYGEFLNVLVRQRRDDLKLEHHEVFGPGHDDWARRIEAPYVIFDPTLSRFNVRSPLHVSTYVTARGVPDRWRTEDKSVRKLELIIFGNRDDRRLRTAPSHNAHVKLPLEGSDDRLIHLRALLLDLFDACQ